MATESNLITLSFPTASATDLSAGQYKAVSVDTNGQIVLATAAKNCDGILQNNPKGGDTAAIAIVGRSKAKLGGTVDIADLLEIGTAGVFVKASTGTAVAKALQAGASGNIISVLMLKTNAVYA